MTDTLKIEELTSEDLRELAERAYRELEDASAPEILQWATRTFGPRFCVTSSMEDAVVAHLASRALPGVDVVFLDTGYHFPETIGTRDAVEAVMDVNVITLTPRQTVAEQDAEHGPKLHDRDPDLCCELRKVKPLEEGLTSYTAWATGLRRDESPTRANTPVVGWDEKRQKVKVSPIARWTQDDVDAYVAEHGVLTNPLLMDGYASVGCAPCTRRVLEGEDARSRPLGRARQDRVRAARLMTTDQENSMSVTETGATIWLTGLPSAGKTTIAYELAGRLRGEGHRVEVLDGDEIREFLSAGLGFSREDRHTNVQRIGFVAGLLAANGVKVLVPVIAPYADSRDAVRRRHQAEGTAYLEVHVATPVEVCSVRDVKGLYAKQAAGELSGLTGVDDPYEAPESPDLRIESHQQTVQESAAELYALLSERGAA